MFKAIKISHQVDQFGPRGKPARGFF